MLNILVINCGSSSLKYQLLEMENETLLAKGLVERIGLEKGKHVYERPGHEAMAQELQIPDHARALSLVLENLTDPRTGVIGSMDEVAAVGHRVVHAGERYASSAIIDDDVIAALEACIPLAPLHNPPNIQGIKAAQQIMPHTPMVGVFDTAFHQTMADWAYIYPLPYEFYTDLKIRRYGFHGTSHRYVTQRAAELLGRPVGELDLITCHLGNGASVCAVKHGKSVDTSMGFTPLEGLVMGTRSGDIDPAIVCFIAKAKGLTLEQVDRILNKESGILGISGVSSDLRDVERAYAAGNDRARLGLDVYSYHIQKYIGAYAVTLGHVDAIVFTAGVGEHGSLVREWACRGLEVLGAELDLFENGVRHDEAFINKPNSRVKILVIPTNEELMIARDVRDLLQGAS